MHKILTLIVSGEISLFTYIVEQWPLSSIVSVKVSLYIDCHGRSAPILAVEKCHFILWVSEVPFSILYQCRKCKTPKHNKTNSEAQRKLLGWVHIYFGCGPHEGSGASLVSVSGTNEAAKLKDSIDHLSAAYKYYQRLSAKYTFLKAGRRYL